MTPHLTKKTKDHAVLDMTTDEILEYPHMEPSEYSGTATS